MVRVCAYIDGFNLYFGLKDSRYKKYYWLNVRSLAKNLLMFNQELAFTKYFTARITDNSEKQKRQTVYIEALETLRDLNDFEIYYGHYRTDPYECPICKRVYGIPHEKMTDVSIATEMLLDASNDRFDKALVISADSDLVPPIKAIRKKYADKSIVVAFPPSRSSTDLANEANAYIHINRATLSQSCFPNRIQKADGYFLVRPAEWT
jgi:uncharacterized LabA/DUF88 family protein